MVNDERYVYDFDEEAPGGRELLGGKGIGLAEMTGLGIPVPGGFTVTTDACRAYMRAGKQVPAGLDAEVQRHVEALEEKSGKRFGDPHDLLLVSVRSGAAISMPGMMDTHPQPRPERPGGRGDRRGDRERALRLRLLPPAHPDVRRGRRRRRPGALRGRAHRAQARARASTRTST